MSLSRCRIFFLLSHPLKRNSSLQYSISSWCCPLFKNECWKINASAFLGSIFTFKIGNFWRPNWSVQWSSDNGGSSGLPENWGCVFGWKIQSVSMKWLMPQKACLALSVQSWINYGTSGQDSCRHLDYYVLYGTVPSFYIYLNLWKGNKSAFHNSQSWWKSKEVEQARFCAWPAPGSNMSSLWCGRDRLCFVFLVWCDLDFLGDGQELLELKFWVLHFNIFPICSPLKLNFKTSGIRILGRSFSKDDYNLLLSVCIYPLPYQLPSRPTSWFFLQMWHLAIHITNISWIPTMCQILCWALMNPIDTNSALM